MQLMDKHIEPTSREDATQGAAARGQSRMEIPLTTCLERGGHMNLDRTFQLELLREMAAEYPRAWDCRSQFRDVTTEDGPKWAANLAYLDEHGLIESNLQIGLDGHLSFGMPRITAKGMDFLADDGGLSAILGVVTIKIHDDTIKSLIQERIQASDLPETEKRRWFDALRELPAETTKQMAVELMKLGLLGVPHALRAVGTYLGIQ
jgi:hypothetical protein